MRPVCAEARDSLDDAHIKKKSKQLREQAVSSFKEKALGQDLTEFENSLRDKISESLH